MPDKKPLIYDDNDDEKPLGQKKPHIWWREAHKKSYEMNRKSIGREAQNVGKKKKKIGKKLGKN